MSNELSKTYSPTEIEDKWYKIWEEKGYFNAQHNSENQDIRLLFRHQM